MKFLLVTRLVVEGTSAPATRQSDGRECNSTATRVVVESASASLLYVVAVDVGLLGATDATCDKIDNA